MVCEWVCVYVVGCVYVWCVWYVGVCGVLCGVGVYGGERGVCVGSMVCVVCGVCMVGIWWGFAICVWVYVGCACGVEGRVWVGVVCVGCGGVCGMGVCDVCVCVSGRVSLTGFTKVSGL